MLHNNKTKYQTELHLGLTPTKSLEQQNIDQVTEKITNSILTAVKKVCYKTKRKATSKLSLNTLKLMEERRRNASKQTSNSFRDLNKKVKKEIRKDRRNYNTKLVQETIDNNCKMKVLRSKLSAGKTKMTTIRYQNKIVNDKKDITKAIEEFYTNLYSSVNCRPQSTKTIQNVGSEELPEITKNEIRTTLAQMKNNKSPGEDQITTEMLKLGGNIIEEALKTLLNKCLYEGKIPKEWYNSEVILLFKKGDRTNIENYRPISLLSHLYKVLTKILTNRLTAKLDFYQPVEQAGFRKGYSTIDHLYTVKTLIEKCTEYNVPVHMAFVDFHKAFDSVETWSLLESLDNARVDSRYTQIIKNIYENATLQVKIDDTTKTSKIPLKRGVRQGDNISPKLFTLALETAFKSINWEKRGINIDGLCLSHLRFADDIVLMATNTNELRDMLQELNQASNIIGLKMNMNKTKIMSQEHVQLSLEGHEIENVNEYIYLGHTVKLGKENQNAEIKRRIRLSWAAFGKLQYIFKNEDIPINLKRRVYNTCILPVTSYGLETMSLTKKSANKLRTSQRAMERSMLGISLRQKIRNEEIRRQTKVRDVIEEYATMKWRWAGHVARQQHDRWSYKTTAWRPRETKRSVGRPQKRWVDDIRTTAGRNWVRVAQDREHWKILGETFIQEWMDYG